MPDKANVQVRLLESDGGGGDKKGIIDVTVQFQNGQASSNTATVSVSSSDGFQEEKKTDTFGGAEFGPLPVGTYTVTVGASGYQTVSVTVKPENFGGPDVTKNF